ncbi:lysophospholipid acyltransferase family protein [Variovorax dokdonensis]|uniref:Lysophospholipid acyltransferase family protein n=1 Tax=Variovorax dokdonensis TaxID=344883 RepID=A0ABT7NBS7_9BURK|nr:lysophospholipid acyltransferase family protein [Variovorax dokdonensis]MDM0045378.1 lysophospholipid acyltransferase family protein [Variovorax dokdonensis]
MLALFRLLARLPLPLMHRLGTLLGWLAWWGSSGYRRRFRTNAEAAGFTKEQYRPAIAAAGAALAELPWLWGRPQGESVLPKVVSWSGVDTVEAALAERRGVIFLAPHVGSWELLGQAMAERFVDDFGPMTALYRPARKAWMTELVDGSRDRRGLKMLPTNTSGVRGLMRALKSGGYTGILPDQVPPRGQGVWAPFFGRQAYTMTLVPRLAQQTGAKVFTAVCERLAPGEGYAIRFAPLDEPALRDPKAPVEEAAAAMNRGIEGLIRELPGQYIWDYARYKDPRAELEVGS